MKWLFDSADRFLQKSSWKDLAVIKFCLFSMGVLAGTFARGRSRKPVRILAGVVFLSTYIPLMAKYFRILFSGEKA